MRPFFYDRADSPEAATRLAAVPAGLPKPSGGGGERVPTTGETAESVHETTTSSRRLGPTDRFAGESARERHGWSGPFGSPGGGVQLGVSVGGFPLGGRVRVRSSRVAWLGPDLSGSARRRPVTATERGDP
jgi:hypothetical protein